MKADTDASFAAENRALGFNAKIFALENDIRSLQSFKGSGTAEENKRLSGIAALELRVRELKEARDR